MSKHVGAAVPLGATTGRAPRAALVVVGGSPQPIVCSLNLHRPEFICFFVSAGSSTFLESDVRPGLSFAPRHFDWIETPDPQELGVCFASLWSKLPATLEHWGVGWHELVVDYTGGTKSMAAAAVLATIRHPVRYSYVGARDPGGRTAGGTGTVIDGQEQVLVQPNPWSQLAVLELDEIALLFNNGRFAAARSRAEALTKVLPAGLCSLYEALANCLMGFDLWDRFERAGGYAKLRSSLPVLEAYAASAAGRSDRLVDFAPRVRGALLLLEPLAKEQKSPEWHRLDLLDLLANADRRASEGRYDDAVARLYSATEALARYRLQDEYGISNSKVRLEQVPEAQRDSFLSRFAFRPAEGETVRLALEGSYELLVLLGDDLGMRYQGMRPQIQAIQDRRNFSRLAHGTASVGEDTYRQLRATLMALGEFSEQELPRFPEL